MLKFSGWSYLISDAKKFDCLSTFSIADCPYSQ